MLSIATLETGDLQPGPTGRSTPVVGRKRTDQGKINPVMLVQFYQIGGCSSPLSVATQRLGITLRGTRNHLAFIPTLAFGRVRGFRE